MRRSPRILFFLALLMLGWIGLGPPAGPARAASEASAPDADIIPFTSPPRLGPPPTATDPLGDRPTTRTPGFAGTRSATAGLEGAWVELPPPARAGHSAIYDPVRNRMVVIGGHPDDPRRGVWVLGLSGPPHWEQVPTSGTAPPAIYDAAGAYDSARDRILVWDSYSSYGPGGVYALSLSSMTWSELPVIGPAPPLRTNHTMVYDSVRDRLLVFAGWDYEQSYQDVWAFNLSGPPAWTQLTPTGGLPPARSYHVAIYDPVRDRMIAFGGYGVFDPNLGASTLPDTWELSLAGTPAWTPLEPAGITPFGTARAAAAYDAPHDRMLVYGGEFWNGASGGYSRVVGALSFAPALTWQTLVTAAPGGRPLITQSNSAMYDPVGNRVITFGGISLLDYYAGPIPDAWAVTLGAPPTWTRLTPGTPSAAGRIDRSVIYDSARLRLVMFGGAESSGDYCCDVADIPTWAYSIPSGAWQTLDTTTTRPPRRMNHTAIYDPVRDRMVLYGGQGGPIDPSSDLRYLNFAGFVGWSLIAPFGLRPPGRAGHSAIYDPVRDRMIVFGGSGLGPEVWALSLADLRWGQLLPGGTPPSARHGHAAIYDPAGDRMIVFGGASYGTPDRLNAWALSLGGSPVWTPLPQVPPPPYTNQRTLGIYDPLRQRLVVLGGLLDDAFKNQVWALNLVGSPTWTRLDIGGFEPPYLFDATANYDPLNDRVVIPASASSQLYALAFPPGPTPTLVSLVSAEADPGRVRVVWQLAVGAGAVATVQRRTPDSAWQEVDRVSADGLGRVAYEDAAPAAGTRYGYRLGLEGAGAGGEVWVDVPVRPVFALRGAVPNPAIHGLRVEFSLLSAASAKLEVIDIAGRRVLSQEVGPLGPGAHAMNLDEAAGLRPGLYLIRLTQAGASRTARALIVP